MSKNRNQALYVELLDKILKRAFFSIVFADVTVFKDKLQRIEFMEK